MIFGLLFLAPPPFKVKHRKNRLTESRSPFSSDRKYDLPTGSGFQVKKSEKKLTEFKEFKHHEGEWKVGKVSHLITFIIKSVAFQLYSYICQWRKDSDKAYSVVGFGQ